MSEINVSALRMYKIVFQISQLFFDIYSNYLGYTKRRINVYSASHGREGRCNG